MIAAPEQHAAFLHDEGRGQAVLAYKNHNTWQEMVVPIQDIGRVVGEYTGKYNVYLTQNRFWSRRRISHLTELNALFTDIDYYKFPEFQNRDALQIFEMALMICNEKKIPTPTLAIDTGRGLALCWKHSSVPRAAISRWNTAQKIIYEAFNEIGSDAMARDAARVLRLIGTRNGKNKKQVRCIFYNPYEWPFDDLANEILPLTRAELHDLRVHRLKNHVKKKKLNIYIPTVFNGKTLWEARLTDLQKLLEMRHCNGMLPPGQRNNWLFISSVAMSWICLPEVLKREVVSLASQVAGWPEAEALSNMGAVIRRALYAARGGKVNWKGYEFDAKYRMSNDTIIDWLNITENEQRMLQTIINSDIARERNTVRKRQQRGGLSRDQYLGKTEDRKREVIGLKNEGKTNIEIARELGIHRNTVSNILNVK